MLHTRMHPSISWAPQGRFSARHLHQFFTPKITRRKISNRPRIDVVFDVLGMPSGHVCNKPGRVDAPSSPSPHEAPLPERRTP
ncbi:hypothetical protein E5345_11785 [Propionibacterium sp. NM47_B9-13]|uniref:Uncharacterized protein n=1 Tax=Cutibacterium modestum HL044PA1 TaxID=765109 RepID=A0ABN0C7Y8_9ACTN|nr:hypothetical protein HMPREF9607_00561 [Cutibacterium modestum HL044PA1]REB75579.1 hypothetical protein CP877_05145 [Cutibacterium modestum]TGY27646.1 hypothetical protein E5345_11785 [Propionibacterium sp. NM47_B9-13]